MFSIVILVGVSIIVAAVLEPVCWYLKTEEDQASRNESQTPGMCSKR